MILFQCYIVTFLFLASISQSRQRSNTRNRRNKDKRSKTVHPGSHGTQNISISGPVTTSASESVVMPPTSSSDDIGFDISNLGDVQS